MKQDRLTRYTTLLRTHLSLLEGHNAETVVGMEGEAVLHADPNDRAALETDRNFDLRLRDRDRKLIGKIREALQRIGEGTFGVCAECGGKIADKRLKARPVTTQCIECKKEQERLERRER